LDTGQRPAEPHPINELLTRKGFPVIDVHNGVTQRKTQKLR
jgi:hypothetical protein